MTSPRRLARAAGPASVAAEGAATSCDTRLPPIELLDAGHVVWADPVLFIEFMEERGLQASPSARFLRPIHSENRRANCASQWAHTTGQHLNRDGHPDWRRLRALGLVG